MDLKNLLDGKIDIQGSPLPTLREIIEKHFLEASNGNEALGHMMTTSYVQMLGALEPSSAAKEEPQPESRPKPETSTKSRAAEQPKTGPSDAEALLKSFGMPVNDDGRIDIMGALASAMTPEGSKTPLGTLFGTLVRGIGEAGKPRV